MTKANRAYDALTKVLVLDVQHQLNLNAFDPEKQKRCKTQPAMSHLFLSRPMMICALASPKPSKVRW